MKHARRLLAGLLTAVMLLALLPTAFAAEDDPLTRGQARDILLAAADDYNPGVKAEDVLQGDKDGNLYLDRPVTRVELLVMLSNAFGQLPEPVGDSARIAFPAAQFTDVPNWAGKTLENVFQAGIVSGTSETTFSPKGTVTEEELDVLIRRVYALEGSNEKDDFYAAVNKEWLETAEFPPGYPYTGTLYQLKASPERGGGPLAVEGSLLQPQQQRRNTEIGQQGHGVHQGGNKGAGHDRRVKAQLFSQHGQRAADELGRNGRDAQGQADHRRHCGGQTAEQQQAEKVHCRQSCRAQYAHPQLLPDHPRPVAKADLPQAQSPDHCHRGLTAAVAAGVHQHGDKGGQRHLGRQRVLKVGDDAAGEGGGQHQQQQPRDPAEKNPPDRRLQIGPLGGGDGSRGILRCDVVQICIPDHFQTSLLHPEQMLQG